MLDITREANVKELLDDAVSLLRLCVNSTSSPASPLYCTMAARKILDAFDACKEALDKIKEEQR